MKNSNGGGFFDRGIIYDLKFYKDLLAVKRNKNDDTMGFKCAICIPRHNLFNHLKKNYNEIFDKISSLLEEYGFEAEDIDIGKGIDDPIDNEFYFSVVFRRGRYKLEVKISLYTQGLMDKEKDFLIVNTSVNAELDFTLPISLTVTMTGIRDKSWIIANWVNYYFSDILRKNKLPEETSVYLLESLTAGSNKLNRELVTNLSKFETAKKVSLEIRKEVAEGYQLLDKLITRKRKFPPYIFSWRSSSSIYDGQEATYWGRKIKKDCGVIIAGTDNPTFSHKNTERMIKDELFQLK